MSTFFQRVFGGSSRAVAVSPPAPIATGTLPEFLARAASTRRPIKNAGTSIVEFTRGSQAWDDLFGPTLGLPMPNRQSAMTSTAIYACVNLIAGAIMAMPMNVFRVNIADGERDRIFDDDLCWILNEEFSPRWPSSSGWEFLVSSLLFEGDAFAIILRDRMSRPIGLEPVHPLRVTVGLAQQPGGSRLVYRVEPEVFSGKTIGQARIVDQDDMIHVAGFGFDGARGMSPLRYALRQAGAIALATQDYAANFFANSARPDYALKTDQVLSPEKVEEMIAQIDARHRSPNNAHRPMLLQGGLDIKTWSISASDMQLLATRQFQIEEIARAYGVPPFMIGANEKTTSFGSGIESMGKGFVRYALRQHLHKFEVEINRKLFRTASRIAEFDTSDLERADTKTLMESLRVAIGRAGEPAIMRVNEARAVLRLKKDPAGEALGVNPGTATPASSDPQPQETNP